jgi:hypothetical protein
MVHLFDASGNDFELHIVGYQFPDAEDPQKRFSWNMVEGSATSEEEHWNFRWQALACHEPPRLVRWLLDVAEWLDRPSDTASAPPDQIVFTEPNLALSVLERLSEAARIGIALDLEFKPPAARQGRVGAGNPAWVRINVDSERLRRGAEALAADISRFPDGLASSHE